MKKRPLSVTILSGLLIAAGLVGLAYHFPEIKETFRYESWWVALVRLLAVICGVSMLRGNNWARWLALVWIAYHVVLSGFHSFPELTIHALLVIVFAYFLLGAQAADYFRPGKTAASE